LIKVQEKGDSVVVCVKEKTLVLNRSQARLLLQKLADILGYRVAPRKRTIAWRLEPQFLRVQIVESKAVRPVAVPLDVIRAWCKILSELGAGKYLKRELMTRVAQLLMGHDTHRARLSRYFDGARFDWERFFGCREDFYTYFRAPILVFADLGAVHETRSPYLEVHEIPQLCHQHWVRVTLETSS